jgi:hypothetical protein
LTRSAVRVIAAWFRLLRARHRERVAARRLARLYGPSEGWLRAGVAADRCADFFLFGAGMATIAGWGDGALACAWIGVLATCVAGAVLLTARP